MKSFVGAPALAGVLAVALSLAAACGTARAATLGLEIGITQPAQRPAWQAFVDEFRAANPDVDVHLAFVDAAGQRHALPAELAGDAGPDVFTVAAGEPLRGLVQRGALDDLSDAWKAGNWFETLPSAPAAAGGRQYALPYDTYPWGLFYRRDVLERAGLKEAPRDLSGLLSACSKLRKAGFTPIALGAKGGGALSTWFDFIDLRANGYDFHVQLLHGKVPYGDTDVRRTFLLWRQLADAGCFDANAAALDPHGAEALLYAGRAGMVLAGTIVSAGFPEIVRPQIGYARFPTIDASRAAAEPAPTGLLAVNAHGRDKADARRFLKFAASSGSQARLAQALGSFPANRLASVPGTVIGLSAYKVLSDAKANLVQGYDREVPEAMAAAGALAFQEFLAQPSRLYPLLDRLDAVRATAYAASAAPGP